MFGPSARHVSVAAGPGEENSVARVRTRWRQVADELTGRTRRRELFALAERVEDTVERTAARSPAYQAATENLRALDRLDRLAEEWSAFPARDERINEHLTNMLDKASISGGRVLEIGGRDHPRARVFDPQSFTYDNMDIVPEIASVTADITDCPQIADGSFDVILSVDVFEHITQPWLAAGEITRLLAPGGLAYTSTLFSWRYHPCPVDFWRYTPDALEFLFGDLELLDSGFDLTERRRDFRRRSAADPTTIDALGGWRENIRVFHAAVKPAVAA